MPLISVTPPDEELLLELELLDELELEELLLELELLDELELEELLLELDELELLDELEDELLPVGVPPPDEESLQPVIDKPSTRHAASK